MVPSSVLDFFGVRSPELFLYNNSLSSSSSFHFHLVVVDFMSVTMTYKLTFIQRYLKTLQRRLKRRFTAAHPQNCCKLNSIEVYTTVWAHFGVTTLVLVGW